MTDHPLAKVLQDHLKQYRGSWLAKLTDEMRAALIATNETDMKRAAATILFGPAQCEEGHSRKLDRLKEGWRFCGNGKVCPCFMRHFKTTSEATNMERRGVKNAGQSKDVQAKMRATSLERYGVEYTGADPIRQAKAKQTVLDRYGVENVFSNADIQQKIRETTLDRHGVEHISQSPIHRDIVRATVRAKYGVDNVMHIDSVKAQVAATNQRRYGGVAPACDRRVREKMQQTIWEKYQGHPCNQHIAVEHRVKGREDFQQRFAGRKAKEIANETGYHASMIHRYAKLWQIPLDYSGGSHRELEDEFSGCLNNEFGSCFQRNLRILVPENNSDRRKHLEVDFYNLDAKLGIEICGAYYHSEARGRFSGYHAVKHRLAKIAGFRLLQIFEDEWLDHPDAVMATIRHLMQQTKNRCFARSCMMVEVSHADATAFYDRCHVYGGVSATEHIGLIEGEILKACMSFTRRQHAVWEMVRYATMDLVVGGASRLLRAFERRHVDELDRLVSFVDLRWSDGKLYDRLGFSCEEHLPPDFRYLIGNRRIHKFNLRKSSKRFAKYDPNIMTGAQMADAENITRVWDAGKLRMVKTYPHKTK